MKGHVQDIREGKLLVWLSASLRSSELGIETRALPSGEFANGIANEPRGVSCLQAASEWRTT